jgi:hypothetical protein
LTTLFVASRFKKNVKFAEHLCKNKKEEEVTEILNSHDGKISEGNLKGRAY